VKKFAGSERRFVLDKQMIDGIAAATLPRMAWPLITRARMV